MPTAAIDWLTGYAHFGGDKIRFNQDGSGFLAGQNISWDKEGNANFDGIVQASLMYSNSREIVADVSDRTYAIDLVNAPANLFVLESANNKNLVVTLPSTSQYDGITLRFFAKISGTSATVKVSKTGADTLYFKDSGNYVSGSWQDSSTVRLLNQESYTVSAIGNSWYFTVGVATYG